MNVSEMNKKQLEVFVTETLLSMNEQLKRESKIKREDEGFFTKVGNWLDDNKGVIAVSAVGLILISAVADTASTNSKSIEQLENYVCLLEKSGKGLKEVVETVAESNPAA